MVSNKLHLGSGKDYRPGWVNVEHPSSDLKAEVVQDLNDKIWDAIQWYADGKLFDHIEMHHVLEHLDNPCNALENIWHLCNNRAKVIISVPHWSNPMTHSDWTHKTTWTGKSFHYFDKDETDYPEYHSKIAKFKVLSKHYTITRTNYRWTRMFDWVLNISPVFTEYVFARFVPISQVIFELEAIK